MKIHEYQAKALFAAYGIPIPRGKVARTAEEALKASQEIGSLPIVIKAQIHAGGRGKGGGIKVIQRISEVETAASELLGRQLVTLQTGPEGKPVSTILVEEALDVKKELYLGIAIDRSRERLVVLASADGGMEIEQVARETPEKVLTEVVDPAVGLRPFQANRIAFSLGLDPSVARKASGIILKLYRLFNDKDCSLAEINPLVVLDQGIICMGPATRSGCGGLCPKANVPCRGCYGPPPHVSDQGAKMVSALASVIDAHEPEEIERILDQIADPMGTFYRFSMAHSILRRVEKL